MTHKLKTWPGEWEAVARGDKSHEVRDCSDRSFSVGDTLVLAEWNPATEKFTGRSVMRIVTYITVAGSWGLPPNICVLSIE